MFDELERLAGAEALRRLLGQYAAAGAADRAAWQDRVMHLDGVDARALVRLHGELIAFGWVEQNTGHTPVGRPGVAAGCYRITPAGLRALAEVRDRPAAEAAAPPVPAAGAGAAGDVPVPGPA